MLSNDRICEPTYSRKAWHLSYQSFLSSKNKAWCSDLSQFLSLVSMVFARNAWDHDPILAHTHNLKKEWNSCIFCVSQLNETNKEINKQSNYDTWNYLCSRFLDHDLALLLESNLCYKPHTWNSACETALNKKPQKIIITV